MPGAQGRGHGPGIPAGTVRTRAAAALRRPGPARHRDAGEHVSPDVPSADPPAAGGLASVEAARMAVAALIGSGVRYVVVAPGSRSAPMAYALAEADAAGRVELLVRIDERDAGFTALGLALATGAHQTTVQPDLFGEHVRFAADVPAGENPLRAVETALSAATGAFEDIPPGPVQLNLAFRDPLVPAAR